MESRPSRWRWIVGGALLLTYLLLAFGLTAWAGETPLAMLVELGPVAGLAWLGLWTSGRIKSALLATLAAGGLGWLVASGRLAVPWLYLLQHAGVHLALAAWFGATLRAGRVPLISALAGRLHGALTPALAQYTRRLTAVWVGYFIAMSAVSILLFVSGFTAAWALLATVLTPLALALMFGGEYLLRYRLHPEFERVSPLSAMRAWQMHRADATGMPCASTEGPQ